MPKSPAIVKGSGDFSLTDRLAILLLTPWEVSKDKTRSAVLLGLSHGVDDTSVVGVDCDGRDVDVSHVQGVESKILLTLPLGLLASERREG